MDLNKSPSVESIGDNLSNIESSLDKSNIDINPGELYVDVDTKNSPTNYDLDVEFGRDVTYCKVAESTIEEYSAFKHVDNNLNDETKQNENEEILVEEIIGEPVKEIKNKDGKIKVVKKFDNPNYFGTVCDVCSKTVYPMERLMYDKKCYHKSCLKCCKCGKTLNPTVVSKYNNKIFCKPHYIELFRKRGRYDDINVDSGDKTNNGMPGTVGGAISKSPEIELSKNEKVLTVSGRNSSGDTKDSDHRLTKEEQFDNHTELIKANSNHSNDASETENQKDKVKNLLARFQLN